MIKEVSDLIYGQRVYLIIDATDAQVKAHCEKNAKLEIKDDSVLESDPANYGSALWCGGLLYLWIENKDKWDETLVHECGHVALSILDYAGFVPDHESKHEPFTYLLGYYYSACMKHLKPYMAKK